MADHIRKQIRAGVIASLKAANISGIGTKVFGNRARKILRNECPCLIVYTNKEPASVSLESPREYMRNLELAIEIVVAVNAAADDDLDDQVDAFAVLIEAVIFTDYTQGGFCEDTILGDTDLDIIDDGEKPIGAGKITFQMPYRQVLPQLDTSTFDDLKTADIKIGPAEPQNVDKNNELSEDTMTGLDT